MGTWHSTPAASFTRTPTTGTAYAIRRDSHTRARRIARPAPRTMRCQLNWRALPDDGGASFGTVEPTPAQFADAEDAVRRLQTTLTRVTAA